ncbi:hypothetical protein DPMN_127981 [Dreissena polymorpha]|uniref:Uncharacterized protein n=1 Tax=Dreissena polymorpha TaxID=45954 RepID=A0A9D4GYP7_DREPO|nr:hypothetical protein DPMN_127981 [Dreissena polymorpha]
MGLMQYVASHIRSFSVCLWDHDTLHDLMADGVTTDQTDPITQAGLELRWSNST